MVEVWDEYLINAKYHLAVARRLHDNFLNYETKRFLSSTINELAICSTYIINATILKNAIKNKKKISSNPDTRLKVFKNISDKKNSELLLTIIRIKKAQKGSPIEIMKKNEIMLLDNGEYKTLTYERLAELINELSAILKEF